MTKTVKASTTILNATTGPLVTALLEAHDGLATATSTVDASNKALGKAIDSKTGINCRAFPLIDARPTAKFETFDAAQKKAGLNFSKVEWLRAMVFVDEFREMHKASNAKAEFKTVLQSLKRHCMYWPGTTKGKDAVTRAKKAKLANPEGKVKAKPKATPKAKEKKVDALTENKQLFALLITSFNTLADAQGIAGLPAKPTREEAYELVAEAQRMMHAG
jgi:hypothetical protein